MSEWISVKDRLPKTGAYCWVVWGGHTQRISYSRVGLGFACVDGYEWEPCDCISDAIPDAEVTHWQPLPDPPKEAA